MTCEAGGDIYVVDTTTYTSTAHFTVPPRPRSVAFLPGSNVAFIPSESSALLNVIDTANPRVIKTISLPEGARPMRIEVARDGKAIYVSEGRSAASRYSTPTRTRYSTASRWATSMGN